MTGWLNEIKTSVHTVVYDLLAVDAIFLLQIRVETRFDVIHYRLPAAKMIRQARDENMVNMPLIIIYKVSESRGVDDSQPKANAVFLDI